MKATSSGFISHPELYYVISNLRHSELVTTNQKTHRVYKYLRGVLTSLFSTGFALNVLALLPHMLEHFDEPDEFSKTCADHIVQVIQ